MADQHQRRFQRRQFAFQPLDRRQIEMVGRLVEQQDVGPRRQGAGERRPPRLAARERVRCLGAGQAELAEQVIGARRIVARHQAGLDIGVGVGIAGQARLLGEVADGGAGLGEAVAVIGFHQPCRDLEQRRFSRTVAAHKAQALAGRDGKFRAGQQVGVAERYVNVLQKKERGGHGRLISYFPAISRQFPACKTGRCG
ncbi:MAG: hypothetical protein WDN08_20800 [Rhizomicrobium sp.]